MLTGGYVTSRHVTRETPRRQQAMSRSVWGSDVTLAFSTHGVGVPDPPLFEGQLGAKGGLSGACPRSRGREALCPKAKSRAVPVCETGQEGGSGGCSESWGAATPVNAGSETKPRGGAREAERAPSVWTGLFARRSF